MAGVNNQPLDIENIERILYNDLKEYLIHHFDIYNILKTPLIYPDNILIG